MYLLLVFFAVELHWLLCFIKTKTVFPTPTCPVTDLVSSLCSSQDWSTTTSTASRKPSRRCSMFGWRFNRIANFSVRGGGANWLWPMGCSVTPAEERWHHTGQPGVPELHPYTSGRLLPRSEEHVMLVRRGDSKHVILWNKSEHLRDLNVFF